MFIFYLFTLALAVFSAWLYGRSTDRVIAETNHETEVVKNENLKLRKDLDEEAGKVAGLQKAASDAVAAQQRVQTQLSEQQGRTAILEKAATDAKAQLTEQQGRTASLEKTAADAKATQQRVETELSMQKERTATAERQLAEVRRLQLPRSIPLNLRSAGRGIEPLLRTGSERCRAGILRPRC
jgi:chromosome segregation ATPase